MPDEQLPETPPPATTPAAAPAQQPPVNALDLPEVRAAIASAVSAAAEQARNATWKQARETLGKKNGSATPETPPAPQPSPQPAAQPAGLTFADLARFQAFNAAAAEHGIPPAGVEMLLGQWGEARPTDTRAWVGEKAVALGWSKPAPATPTPSGQPPAAPAASPAPAQPATPTPSGSPPAPSAGVYDPKPSQMKPADAAAYIAKNGPKAWMALVRQELAGTRVTPPPRR